MPTTKPTEPTIPTTKPTEPTDPTPPTPVGWKRQGGKWYYFNAKGELTIGFAEINGSTYYFDPDGAMHTGWLDIEEGRYYFSPGGLMQTGWILVENVRYYLNQNGAMHTGWLDWEGKRYFLGEDGTIHVGWLFYQEEVYYCKQDGVMAKGMVEIEGEKNYFTSTGAYIMLVNPWNFMPDGYEPELKTLSKYGAGNRVDVRCYDALMQMLADCHKAAGNMPLVCSSYRTMADQTRNYENRVKRFMNEEGYDRAEAERRAAQVVAVPGTSEHQLGLAVDIVDITYQLLDSAQEKTPVQKWLIAHSWEYGFILRYPVGATAFTGIIYEPWHYRYVGKELAKELHEKGGTLEEYLQQLTDEAKN